MRCYNCDCNLTEHSFCTNCRVDVSSYKLAISASNLFYNDGLEKAGVRDLSGAIVSLRQCLKLNKNHVDARNLLGLVYFELGEGIQALNEWVISKNLQSRKNVADDYLNRIQKNPAKLEALNSTIKKYNQALAYCCQGSLDLALIQLKKALSMNPGYLQAHLLLALLYLRNEDWPKARREVDKSLAIDVNNTMALRYRRELELAEAEAEGAQGKPGRPLLKKRSAGGEAYQYLSGNETIIQPYHAGEGRAGSSILNLLIGLAIGLAAAWFLLLPAMVQGAKADVNEEIKAVSEQLDVKAATINELESRIKALETENFELESQLEGFVGEGGTLEDVEYLLQAVGVYLGNPDNLQEIAEYLEKISPQSVTEGATDSFLTLYQLLLDQVGEEIGREYYDRGIEAYQDNDLETAVEELTRAAAYDGTNMDAYYNLANAYRKLGKDEEALEAYLKVIELFPGTDTANRSQSYINEINGNSP